MRWRVPLGAVGALCMAYAALSILLGGVATSFPDVAAYLVGLVVLHDIIFAAPVAVLGWLLTRALPPRPRAVAQGGLFAAACSVVIAVPLLTGRGGHGNPTVDPLDYPRNLLLILSAIALCTAATAAVRTIRR